MGGLLAYVVLTALPPMRSGLPSPALGWPGLGWPALGWPGVGWPALGWTAALALLAAGWGSLALPDVCSALPPTPCDWATACRLPARLFGAVVNRQKRSSNSRADDDATGCADDADGSSSSSSAALQGLSSRLIPSDGGALSTGTSTDALGPSQESQW